MILENENKFTPIIFPPPKKTGRGIVAVTEDINTDLLISAYLQGIFPWYNEDEGEPVVWWSPDPRFVLLPEEFHIPSRLKRFLKHSPYKYTIDTAFEDVIKNCANVKRSDQDGTWIGKSIIESYTELFYMGLAHSVEVWHDDKLVGGFYGVLFGQVFCGESMFTLENDSAKSAFVLFVEAFKKSGGKLIDSQVYTDNIARFGGKNISRVAFLRMEKEFLSNNLQFSISETFKSVVESSKQ